MPTTNTQVLNNDQHKESKETNVKASMEETLAIVNNTIKLIDNQVKSNSKPNPVTSIHKNQSNQNVVTSTT